MNALSDVPHILIVEQDVAVQAAVAMPLYEAGYVTATTRHKDEAIAVLIERPYDAVILDPFEGGGMLELLHDLRNNDLLNYPLVVVVTTQTARARDALVNGWADMAFDKDGIDWYMLAQSIGDMLASV